MGCRRRQGSERRAVSCIVHKSSGTEPCPAFPDAPGSSGLELLRYVRTSSTVESSKIENNVAPIIFPSDSWLFLAPVW